MIITKNTPLDGIIDGEPIFINKEVSLDSKLLELILSNFPNSKIIISTYSNQFCSTIENDVLYDEKELSKLVENAEIAEKYNKVLTFDENYSLEQAIYASRQINYWADFINNLKINGEPLSQLEKFMIAYSLVSNKVYSEDPDKKQNSRNIISVLSSDKIVCCGYANALSVLCNRIGVPCTYRLCTIDEQNEIGNHANCIVNINDKKYGVNGIFVADPTWDSIDSDSEKYAYNFKFNHFLLTHNEFLLAYPNVKFDKLISIKKSGDSNYVPMEIQNINSLYPDFQPPTWLKENIINPELQTLNYDDIREELKKRIQLTFPKNLKNKTKNSTPPDPLLIRKISSMFLEFTFSNKPMDTIPPIVLNNYRWLNISCSETKILNTLLESVDHLPNEEILNKYCYLLESDNNKNRYNEYIRMLYSDLDKTKPIKEPTLEKLFQTIIPVLTNQSGHEITQFANKLALSRLEFITQMDNPLSQK